MIFFSIGQMQKEKKVHNEKKDKQHLIVSAFNLSNAPFYIYMQLFASKFLQTLSLCTWIVCLLSCSHIKPLEPRQGLSNFQIMLCNPSTIISSVHESIALTPQSTGDRTTVTNRRLYNSIKDARTMTHVHPHLHQRCECDASQSGITDD